VTWDTVNVLAVSQARKVAGKLAGEILNVLGMDKVGTSQVHCPFPCNVLVMSQPSKLALAPSESYNRTWPHSGNKADDELDFDGLGESDKENKWVVAASSV